MYFGWGYNFAGRKNMTEKKIDFGEILKKGLLAVFIFFYCLCIAFVIGGYNFFKTFYDEFKARWGEIWK